MDYLEEIKEIDIIKKLESHSFYENLLQVWEKAIDNLHPFQKGDSHQATQHCYMVLNYLSELSKLIDLTPLEEYLLCFAVAVHDVDKAIFDYENRVKLLRRHGVESAKFISDNYTSFDISKAVAEAVCIIVRHHGDRSMKSILKKHKPKTIKDPVEYKDYGKVRYGILSSIFKLADIMDVTYKRVSEYVVKLNFPDGKEVASKILARSSLDDAKIFKDSVYVDTSPILDFKTYQAVLIAIDMMNNELRDSNAAKILGDNGLPFKFSIDFPALDDEINELATERKKISDFNSDNLLTIQDGNEDDLFIAYNDHTDLFEFSPTELDELRNKNNKIYAIAAAKEIPQLREGFKSVFGYSIDELEVLRKYEVKNRRIDNAFKYKGIKKAQEMTLQINYEIYEGAKNARFVNKYCELTESPNKEKFVKQILDEGTLNYILPDLRGFSEIEMVAATVRSEGAWCWKKNEYKDLYPDVDNDKMTEEFFLSVTYPICKVTVKLAFPWKYIVEPECIFKFKDVETKITMNYDSAENAYILENLHSHFDFSHEEYPIYTISWEVPE